MSEIHATLNWILGRFRMPVLCEREDGSVIQLEEAVVFRPAAEDARGMTVKATFFGIDVAGAKRCYNLIEPEIPDRRGVLYLTYIAQDRSDIGLSDFRHSIRDGEVTYQVTRGRLRVRPIGDAETEPLVLEFEGRQGALTVSRLRPTSDGYKLLAPFAREQGVERLPLRRLSFRLELPDAASVRGYYLEDAKR